MCECLRNADGSGHICEACAGMEEHYGSMIQDLQKENEALRELIAGGPSWDSHGPGLDVRDYLTFYQSCNNGDTHRVEVDVTGMSPEAAIDAALERLKENHDG